LFHENVVEERLLQVGNTFFSPLNNNILTFTLVARAARAARAATLADDTTPTTTATAATTATTTTTTTATTTPATSKRRRRSPNTSRRGHANEHDRLYDDAPTPDAPPLRPAVPSNRVGKRAVVRNPAYDDYVTGGEADALHQMRRTAPVSSSSAGGGGGGGLSSSSSSSIGRSGRGRLSRSTEVTPRRSGTVFFCFFWSECVAHVFLAIALLGVPGRPRANSNANNNNNNNSNNNGSTANGHHTPNTHATTSRRGGRQARVRHDAAPYTAENVVFPTLLAARTAFIDAPQQRLTAAELEAALQADPSMVGEKPRCISWPVILLLLRRRMCSCCHSHTPS
jgi:hypothetical protein